MPKQLRRGKVLKVADGEVKVGDEVFVATDFFYCAAKVVRIFCGEPTVEINPSRAICFYKWAPKRDLPSYQKDFYEPWTTDARCVYRSQSNAETKARERINKLKEDCEKRRDQEMAMLQEVVRTRGRRINYVQKEIDDLVVLSSSLNFGNNPCKEIPVDRILCKGMPDCYPERPDDEGGNQKTDKPVDDRKETYISPFTGKEV